MKERAHLVIWGNPDLWSGGKNISGNKEVKHVSLMFPLLSSRPPGDPREARTEMPDQKQVSSEFGLDLLAGTACERYMKYTSR